MRFIKSGIIQALKLALGLLGRSGQYQDGSIINSSKSFREHHNDSPDQDQAAINADQNFEMTTEDDDDQQQQYHTAGFAAEEDNFQEEEEEHDKDEEAMLKIKV